MSRIRPVTARPAPPTIYIKSTLRTAPVCVKRFNCSGSNGNSYTVCTVSDMCVYTHTHVIYNIETLVGQTKLKNLQV